MTKRVIYLMAVIYFICPLLIKAEQAGYIVISEIQITGGSGASTNEFVEIYNPTDSDISLSGWQLIKKTASGNEYGLVEDFGEQEIKSHSFFMIAHPAGYLGEVQPDAYYSTTNSISSNNTILLVDGVGNEVDKLGLGTASDFEGETFTNPGSNKSAARKARSDSTNETMVEGGAHYFLGNGEDSQDNAQDFIMRSEPEPQNSQSELEYLDIEVPQIPEPVEEPEDPVVPEQPNDPVNEPLAEEQLDYSKTISITELFPNPEGKDDSEFIELYNNGSVDVDLTGWQLGDNSTRRYTISADDFNSTIIKDNEYFVVDKNISGISLNNTSDSAKLYQPNKILLDSVEYSGCQEAQSYSLVSNEWIWTDEITSGQENVFIIKNELPVAIFELENTEIKVGQIITFDASESRDPDNDKLEFFWDFGNGEQAEGEKIEYSFSAAGQFDIVLRILDTKGGEDEAGAGIIVSDYDYSSEITISELLPACSPSDKECEFIELHNFSSQDINLDGWQLMDLKTNYTFSDEDSILSGDYMAIERSESKITLNNSGDTVYLVDPAGQIINGVEYEKAKKDFSFSRDSEKNNWQWTAKPTPGEENEIIIEELEGEEGGEVNQATGEEGKEVISDEPIEIVIGDINEDFLGKLLRVTGEVESANSRGIYLMDELGNTLRVYIQKKTGIAQPNVEPRDMMTVTGILDKTSAGLRLLPRTEQDIVVTKKTKSGTEQVSEEGQVLGASVENEVIDFPVTDKAKQVRTYLIITAAVLLAGLGGVVVRWYLKNKSQPKADPPLAESIKDQISK